MNEALAVKGETMWVKACAVDDVEDGEILKVEFEEVGALAIHRIGDDYYATSDICTHGEASLSEDGYLEGFNVICTWHHGAFDVRTGEVTSLPCQHDLKTYPVELRDGEVMIEI